MARLKNVKPSKNFVDFTNDKKRLAAEDFANKLGYQGYSPYVVKPLRKEKTTKRVKFR